MEGIDLKANKRTDLSKSFTKELRRTGQLPAIVYSKDDNIPIQLDFKTINKVVKDHNIGATIININLGENQAIPTLIKDIQRDPLSWDLKHIDFLWIDMDHAIETTVPIRLKGSARGVKEGGLLEHMLRELKIKCPPANIPDHFDVDVSGLAIGESNHVSDLEVPADVKVLSDPNQVIAMVGSPDTETKEADEEEAETEAVAE
jgi:large subunit ribosomal protein L25